MKRFSIAALFVGFILLVALAPTTMTTNNQNTGANSTLTIGTMVMTSSVSPGLERASPAVNLTNGGTFTYTSPVQTAITLGTYLDQHQSNLLQANMDAGMTVTANYNVNYINAINANNLTTALTNKASPVVIDATQGANLTNDPATINKASPVSNSAVNVATVTLNHNAGTIALMPSTTIKGIAGDNNLVLTSASVRGNVHRMTATRTLSVNMMSVNSTAGTALVATNWSLHRQTTAENSADSRDATTLAFSITNANTAITVTFNGTIT